jgi:hypothetical protein
VPRDISVTLCFQFGVESRCGRSTLPLSGITVTLRDISYNYDIGFGDNNVADFNSILVGDVLFNR